MIQMHKCQYFNQKHNKQKHIKHKIKNYKLLHQLLKINYKEFKQISSN